MLPIHDFAFDTNKRDIMPWSASIFVGLLGTEIWNLNAKIREAKAERRESALKNNTLSDFQSPSGWSQSVSVCVLLSLFECVCVWVQTDSHTHTHTRTGAHVWHRKMCSFPVSVSEATMGQHLANFCPPWLWWKIAKLTLPVDLRNVCVLGDGSVTRWAMGSTDT